MICRQKAPRTEVAVEPGKIVHEGRRVSELLINMNRSYERYLMFVDVAAQWSRGEGHQHDLVGFAYHDWRTMFCRWYLETPAFAKQCPARSRRLRSKSESDCEAVRMSNLDGETGSVELTAVHVSADCSK